MKTFRLTAATLVALAALGTGAAHAANPFASSTAGPAVATGPDGCVERDLSTLGSSDLSLEELARTCGLSDADREAVLGAQASVDDFKVRMDALLAELPAGGANGAAEAAPTGSSDVDGVADMTWSAGQVQSTMLLNQMTPPLYAGYQ